MTVSELMSRLREYHGDLRVGIDDADTQWSLDVLSVTTEEHECGTVVLMSGDYNHEILRKAKP